MSTLRLRFEAQRLIAFRLSDVPENIRRKYGERLVTRAYKLAREDGLKGYALLRVSVKAKQAMLSPSGETYRVSQEAWDAMMAESEKLDKSGRRIRTRERVAA